MISKFRTQVTPSSGTSTFSTDNFNAMCLNLSVSPATASTTYDVQLKNSDGGIVYHETSITGDWSDFTMMGLFGVYTFSILNASVDEVFTINMIIDDIYR